MSKSAAWEERMTRVSGIYEERWRKLWSLSHTKAGVPPNQTGPVPHHICPFQHAHTHTQAHGCANGRIGILGTRVCSTALVFVSRQHESHLRKGWQKYRHSLLQSVPFTRHNHTHTQSKAPFKMSSGSLLRLLYGTRLVPGLVYFFHTKKRRLQLTRGCK